VPWGSAVSVLVIDCTMTGAPPPTGTCRIMTLTLSRRAAGALLLDIGTVSAQKLR
jgi:hypothetical protein